MGHLKALRQEEEEASEELAELLSNMQTTTHPSPSQSALAAGNLSGGLSPLGPLRMGGAQSAVSTTSASCLSAERGARRPRSALRSRSMSPQDARRTPPWRGTSGTPRDPMGRTPVVDLSRDLVHASLTDELALPIPIATINLFD